jgi:isocitrate lyase
MPPSKPTSGEPTPFERDVEATQRWFDSPRFAGIRRLYSARQVVEQRGTIAQDHTVAREAADTFHARLRQLFAEKKCVTTFGPYSPGHVVTMKRMGIEAIYLGGWATSAKGSTDEDPGPDLASYPLSQVPDEAAVLVRALLTADRNQEFALSRLSAARRAAATKVDFRPWIIADADTGHGGEPHVRNLVRRFVEAGVPGYHIEDQRPGTKKCGHQGGKVLVSCDEQIKRLNAARFQLDLMGVAGIVVARTDAEAATLLDNQGDERDQPFLLGVTNPSLPSYKACVLALMRRLHAAGLEELVGHRLYALADEEYDAADAWLDARGLAATIAEAIAAGERGEAGAERLFDQTLAKLVGAWEADAGLETYGDAVASVLDFLSAEDDPPEISTEEWRRFARRAGLFAARSRARQLGIDVPWDAERARTPEGYYQVRGGVPYAVAKSLAAAPFADVLWMETKSADLAEAREFAEAIHAEYPDQLLAYNLSPSFNWDSTGMSDEEMKRFPEELGKLGYVFNFITYGGHQIDGLAAEEFATALRQDGMLSLARLQRKLRLLESPYRTPQTLVGGPRADEALMAASGRTATTIAMGKGSTQHQHLIVTEVPKKLLEEWLALWSQHYALTEKLKVALRPQRAGSELLELAILDAGASDGEAKVANVVFAPIHDRKGHSILSVRDQNTFEEALRKKRLMTLVHLWMIHRYKAGTVHYVSPTEDNQYQAAKMKGQGLFREVQTEIGQIIVAEVDPARVAELLAPDRAALGRLIRKEG